MQYEHTQHGPLSAILATVAFAWTVRAHAPVCVIVSISVMILLVLAGVFHQLTIRDAGEWLDVRFGPLPGFSRQIYYADITHVERSRSSWIDGWGVHSLPGRGTTWNLWGFDCVKLTVHDKTLRLGSDNADGLAKFLQERAAKRRPR